MDKKYEKISQDLGVTLKQIDTVLSLMAEGATIPFIARYRKVMTGSLDEVAIKAIIDLDKMFEEFAKLPDLTQITFPDDKDKKEKVEKKK